jgi:hypothetical protein
MNLRLTMPEIRFQVASDLQVIQLQLNRGNMLREIAPHIGESNVQTGKTATLALRFYNHSCLLFNVG